MNKRPGVMLYFSLRPVLDRLSNEDNGILFDAILQYADTGTTPSLPGSLYVLWPLVQSNLVHDDLRYRQTVIKRKYAAYVRWAKQHNDFPMDYYHWAQQKGYDGYLEEKDEYADV